MGGERRELLQHLAEVHDRIDREDLAYAEQLLERRMWVFPAPDRHDP